MLFVDVFVVFGHGFADHIRRSYRLLQRVGDGVLARLVPSRALGRRGHRVRDTLDRIEAQRGPPEVRV